MKSNCCNAEMIVGGEGTTHYWVCLSCKNSCDPAGEPLRKEQQGWRGTPLDASDHWEYQGSADTYNSFWKTVISSPQWQEWAKEQREECRWDTTEAEECGWLSEEHFQDFLNFTYLRTRKFD